MANSVIVLEQYHAVVPTPETTVVDEMSLPLTFFDTVWINLSPVVERLLFYELPLSHSQFVDSYIPELKDSLSFTLKDFLPLAGNFIYTSDFRNPEIRYRNGDGVSTIFAESFQNNFKYLTANYPRNCHEFYPLIPQIIPKPLSETGPKVSPVLALQVTLFPGAGICLGITNHHVVGDASSIFRFMKTWALRSKHGGEGEEEDASQLLFDKSVIKDPKGLASLLLNQWRSLNLDGNILPPTEKNKIRQTFVLLQKDIQKLKSLVRMKRPTVKHLSTFTVTCAYVWTCLAKYGRPELPDFLAFPVDCRGRVNPPIPVNYFGNCLTFCFIRPNSDQELVGDEAFYTLVDKIGERIHQKLRDKDKVLEDTETWIPTATKIDLRRTISVAGSPKYNYYDLDFGWGKPIKFECTSIDQTGAISFSGCRDSEEAGIELGLSYSREKIEAFARAFNDGLAALNSLEPSVQQS